MELQWGEWVIDDDCCALPGDSSCADGFEQLAHNTDHCKHTNEVGSYIGGTCCRRVASSSPAGSSAGSHAGSPSLGNDVTACRACRHRPARRAADRPATPRPRVTKAGGSREGEEASPAPPRVAPAFPARSPPEARIRPQSASARLFF